jgi:hypothetical protein
VTLAIVIGVAGLSVAIVTAIIDGLVAAGTGQGDAIERHLARGGDRVGGARRRARRRRSPDATVAEPMSRGASETETELHARARCRRDTT